MVNNFLFSSSASISCGASEFYVQLTFNKPFKGLLYAYKIPQPRDSFFYFPLQVLDSCALQGNGASFVYLQLSFLSECVEKVSSVVNGGESSVPNGTAGTDDGHHSAPNNSVMSGDQQPQPSHYSSPFADGEDSYNNVNMDTLCH